MGRPKGQAANAELIALRRRKAGLTQEQLADQAGISVSAVRKVEAGKTVDLATLDLIVRKLELSVEQALYAPPGGPVLVAERFAQFTISPVERKFYEVAHGTVTRLVETDNRAELEYRLKVRDDSPAGTCMVQYATKGGGWVGGVAARPTLPNLAPAFLRGIDERDGATMHYEFEATPGLAIRVVYEALRAFEQGKRDLHSHLFPKRNGYIADLVRTRLDLSNYAKAGWKLRQRPMCYYHFEDADCGQVCAHRRLTDPLSADLADDTNWVWEWHVHDCASGVIDLDWNNTLQPPSGH